MLFLELTIVVALILINGILAMAELAVVSSRRGRLQALVDRNVIGSRRALALASDPGRFISTVQVGITLVGVLSGAFSGATLGFRLAEWFVSWGVPAGIAEAIGVGLVVAVITYFSLIIGELVPKQIALRNPEKIAVKVAPAMTLMAEIASPLVSLLDVSGRVVLRALGYVSQSEDRVTDEEIRTLISEAQTAGVIEPEEREMIAGVMVDLSDDPGEVHRKIGREHTFPAPGARRRPRGDAWSGAVEGSARRLHAG
jgi:putative hemolysin